jgi:two-component system, NarL family, nitrate/nitrite response regulator NarL
LVNRKSGETPVDWHPTHVRTLVVDDSPVTVRAICSFLETQDRIEIVGTASGGRQAVEQAEILHPDLVLLDLQMPEMNGLEVTQRLSQISPASRVIIVTVLDSESTKEACLASGGHGFVLKNRLYQDLPAAIHAVFPSSCSY